MSRLGPARQILIINPFGIGDVLFSTPLIAAVRAAHPAARLSYLCNRRSEDILKHNPHLNDLIVFEKDEYRLLWRLSKRQWARAAARLLQDVARRRFDAAIDLSLNDRYSAVLSLLGVPRRIGFNYRGRGRFLTHRVDISGYQDKHVVEYYRDLLGSIGIPMRQRGLELQPSPAGRAEAEATLRRLGLEGETLVGLIPGGGTSWGVDAGFRRWRLERFAEVGEALAARPRTRILLFGERSDAAICRDVAARMRQPAQNLSGTTTLTQFLHLVARCGLIVCNDGGPLHIAVSLGVPTVSVFGPVNPRVYGPYPPGPRHRVVTRDLACRPCYQYFKLPPCPYQRACLETLEAAPVVAAALELLDGARVNAAAAG